jgi:deoxyinosine 3'endonuclease (endonuclease V)
MKLELEKYINGCLADREFQQYLEMKRKLQKKKENN